jgi:hypothetical protein
MKKKRSFLHGWVKPFTKKSAAFAWLSETLYQKKTQLLHG